MKKCRVSPVKIVASRGTMEPEGCPRKSSTSSPPAPRSSTPELRLAGQASLQIPGVHKPPQGKHRAEDTDDEGDVRRVPTKASAGLARHQGMEELPAIDQLRQRRTPLRETTNTLGHMSPGIAGYLRLRTPSPSCPGTPPTVCGAKADLRRLMGSLDLTSSPERPTASTPNRYDVSPPPRTSPSEMTECPFALPPDVGSGFLLEPPVAASSSHAPVTEQRKFRLTRTRSLPDLRQEAAAPEFLRNRLILQTDDTVYLPFILRKEYVIRTKLRVSFSLLKPPVVRRSHSEGHVTEVTFLQQAYCGYWDETDTELENTAGHHSVRK
ncbi:uncharacterized protein [Dermacentor andersoni]|uniref:uncharacterized protein isoform X2 n=1 Tax=Dermacentor andersoni TaxID=34620 RepID=UPI002416BC60|nr:polycystic kidney disease protein 1-like 3 isoform X2 [Dermacentor andersoni]